MEVQKDAWKWFPKNIPSVSKTTQPASTSLASHHAPAHILPPWFPTLPQEGNSGMQALVISSHIQHNKNQESGTGWLWLDSTMQFGTTSNVEEWSDNFKAFYKHQPTLVITKCSNATMVSWTWKFSPFFFLFPLYYSFIFRQEVRLNHRQTTYAVKTEAT